MVKLKQLAKIRSQLRWKSMAVKLYNPGSRLENLYSAPLGTSTGSQVPKEAEHFNKDMTAWVPITYVILEGSMLFRRCNGLNENGPQSL